MPDKQNAICYKNEGLDAMNREFLAAMEDSPVVAAVKDMEGLKQCFESESRVVFILFGDVCTIADIVHEVKAHGKIAMVHLDLISGLSQKEITVDFIKKYTQADGIISTKQVLIKRARELGMYTVFRFFVIDSMAYENINRQLNSVRPDFIEVLPGVTVKVIEKICKSSPVPVIAGGLIADKEDVIAMLGAGVISISTTNQNLWFI